MIKLFILVIKGIYKKILFLKRSIQWRKLNNHNNTHLAKDFDFKKVKIGKYTYGNLLVFEYGGQGESLIIGNYVSIADGVRFILGGNHQMTTLTTFPLKSIFKNYSYSLDAISKGPIIVEDEVWFGNNVTVLSGVKIGKGAIIAAGSVITKNIPAFSIVGGNPARILKDRFSSEIKDRLLKFNLSDLSEAFIKENIDIFYKPVEEGLNEIQSHLH